MTADTRYKPIEDYGVIGDLHTSALVGLDGSVDFFCFPNFDSPSVFAAVLDAEKGGRFCITPDFESTRTSQLYVPDTNVLLSRFMSEEGIVEISDFMPVNNDPSAIVRIVRAVRGDISIRMACQPAFNYGRSALEIKRADTANTALLQIKPEGAGAPDAQALCLQSSVPLEYKADGVEAHFTLKKGERACFILTCSSCANIGVTLERADALETETIAYWRQWIGQSIYQGRYREIVNRSALVLKLQTSRRFGSIVAAPTFSLPEAIGGGRNWDYRYCWIRDSAFTIYALLRLGFQEEAIAFMKWVETLYQNSARKDGSLQLMYRLDGSTDIHEETLDHLSGYKNSKPVRIGNAASEQFQLDIYGELMDAIYLADKYITKISHDVWQNVTHSVNYVCANWRRPDSGIWEFRTFQREFLHSRVMCWVAVDRAIRLVQKESLPAPLKEWLQARSDIYDDIFTNFWNEEQQSFVQSKGANNVDASLLLMPMLMLIGPRDPKWLSTLDKIGKDLACDALVNRYHPREMGKAPIDGHQEGSFNACSFWYIECLAQAGRTEEAHLLFNKLAGYANHLGLFAEQTAADGYQLGNFPQAFTHLALISAAFALEETRSPLEKKDHPVSHPSKRV